MPMTTNVLMQPTAISHFSSNLQAELTYRFELMQQTAEDEGEAAPVWDDTTVYLLTQDLEGTPLFDDFKVEIMDWWIAKGVYRYITEEEYKATTVMGSLPKAKYFPKHRGQRTTFVKHL